MKKESKEKAVRANLVFVIVALVLVSILYGMTRIPQLMSGSVGYTYDQGRDFLKAADIIDKRDIQLIGPTTGINGLFHGVWWYYLLAIPYVLFQGSPIGFYVFNFIIQYGMLLAIFFFSKKRFGVIPAIIAGLIVVLSPYFTFTSLFVGNNIMVLPSLLLFLMSIYLLFEHAGSWRIWLLNGFLLGMVSEFELSFGLFLVPTYLLSLLLFRTLRKGFFVPRSAIVFFIGLVTVFSPRIVSELKNNFLQTQTLLSFFIHPKLYNPKPYLDILQDRISLFVGYYRSIFPSDWVASLIFVTVVLGLLFSYRALAKQTRSMLHMCLYLLGSLFFLSTLYKDNFWGNYYEGIQYIFLFIILFGAAATLVKRERWHLTSGAIILAVLSVPFFFTLIQFSPNRSNREGLTVQQEVVRQIVASEKKSDIFCVRIYTPPVIPHTYNYLFYHAKKTGGLTSLPQNEWVKGRCWFIVEKDDYAERKNTWLQANNPQRGTVVHTYSYPDIELILWQAE